MVAATLWLPLASTWGNKFELISLLAVATVLPGFLEHFVLAVGTNRFLRETKAPAWQWVPLCIAVFFPLVVAYSTFVPLPTGPRRGGIWIAVGTLGVTLAWLLWLRIRRAHVLAEAATHALPAGETV